MQSDLPKVAEGLTGLKALPSGSDVAAPVPVDTTGMSRVQRMKLLQQQHAALAAVVQDPVSSQPGLTTSQAPKDISTSVAENDSGEVRSVPTAEPSTFPRRPRGTRTF